MKTLAPARVDLAGGTLDVPPLCFLVEKAITLNLAIDLEVNVTLKPSTQWRLIQDGETSASYSDLPPLFQKAFAYLEIEGPLDIQVSSQIPRASGLGGSSTLLVALVKAGLDLLGQKASPRDLLNVVTVLEHKLLGKPAGTQDAIAAIYGGLSFIQYEQGYPIQQPIALPTFLQGDIVLAYSAVQHHSGMNNWGIIKAACEGDRHTLQVLTSLAENAHALHQTLLENDEVGFLKCLQNEAELRGRLAKGWVPKNMVAFVDSMPGQVVGKICGAGGGGCMLMLGDLPVGKTLNELAASYDLEIFRVKAQSLGCRGMQE